MQRRETAPPGRATRASAAGLDSERRNSTAWLDRIYRLPNIYSTFEDWERCNHLDLTDLNLDELYRERRCVQRRADYAERRDPDLAWMRDRVRAVNSEIAKRRRQPTRQSPRDSREPGWRDTLDAWRSRPA